MDIKIEDRMEENIQPVDAFTLAPNDENYKPFSKYILEPSVECKLPIDCEIIGEIPKWINGSFVRAGPGRFQWGTTKVKHLFDGDSIIHSFNLNNGKITYQSQFLKSKYHELNEKYNQISMSGLSNWTPPDPCAGFFKRIALYFFPSQEYDNCNIKVVNIQGQAIAATESPFMVEINPKTAETIRRINIENKGSSASRTWLPHPHYDEEKNYWIFSTNFFPKRNYQLIKIPNNQTKEMLYDIMAEIPWLDYLPSYYHSFLMTRNYFILLENPFQIDGFFKLMTLNIRKKSILDIMKWFPEKGMVFRIICRKTFKELRKIKANATFVFHTVNAYEKNNEVILDVCAYPDDTIIYALLTANLEEGSVGQSYSRPNLIRYRIPIDDLKEGNKEFFILPKWKDGQDFEIIAPLVELPIINYDMVNSHEYNFMYGISGSPFNYHSLVKVNVQTKERIYWRAPKDCTVSEPYFVASPNAKEEDDGVLLSTITGCINNAKSFFIVIDAKTFKEIGRALMPVKMSFTFHSSFWPTNSIDDCENISTISF